jgi:signal transduction histidine kinase
MRVREVLRSSAFRLTLAFVLATTTATLLTFSFVYWQITTSDEQRIRDILVGEAGKGAAYSEDELRKALDLRLTRDLRRLDYVALFDASGRLVLGNVDAMPAIPADGKSHLVRDARPPGAPERTEPAVFVARRRADDSVLLLGRSLVEVYALRETVLDALALAILPTVLLAIALGLFLSQRTTLRLSKLHETIGRIMRGELHIRLPVRKHSDEIDQLSRDVNEMLDEIVRLMVQIRNVGENIAHDLRTPLSVMRVKLERGLAVPAEGALRLAVGQALDELDRTTVAIAALLRVAEVENGPISAKFTTIDLAAICADLFEFYEPLAREKAIAMTLEATPPVPVRGDGDLMREALSNLIDNAIKFTPEQGIVRLSVRMDDGRPCIRVSDNGSGVGQGERDKIFDRYYRAERDNRARGSGVGLSVALAIAKAHGFDLKVEDNHPGAMFELSPRADVAGSKSAAA